MDAHSPSFSGTSGLVGAIARQVPQVAETSVPSLHHAELGTRDNRRGAAEECLIARSVSRAHRLDPAYRSALHERLPAGSPVY